MAMHRRLFRPGCARQGFTLIELLIVIAIILILIAIALPNFLEAQIRAKLTRVHAELRTLTTALEAYQIDFRAYPLDDNEVPTPLHPSGGADTDGADWYSFMVLTTPHKYLTEIPKDYFQEGNPIPLPNVEYLTYNYHEQKSLIINTPAQGAILKKYGISWVVFGIGPDRKWQVETVATGFQIINAIIAAKAGGSTFTYSPTNGTYSLGDIILSNTFLK
jgi:prepilin-type N-terminal cleavage/methylation domain-containing protein